MSNLGFGLIGFGAWGGHHARVIAAGPATRLVAVADCDESRRGELAEKHPEAAFVTDYRQLLARRDVEAVSIALPSHLHHEVACAALDAGKHLFLEKPMTLTAADCRDLIERASTLGLHVAVAHQFRFSTLWGKVRQMIDAGAIGDPLYALIELWRNPYRQGADGWRYDIARVGDWILEEPIHFFDLARWYFAAGGEPVSVYARANARDPQRPELQDNFSAIVNFPQGRYAVVSQTLGGFEHHHTVKMAGSTGALWASWSGAMDRTFHPTFLLKHFDGKQVREVPIEGIPGEVYELAKSIGDLAEAIRAGRPPRVTGDDGLWSVLLCAKAQESVTAGGVVQI